MNIAKLFGPILATVLLAGGIFLGTSSLVPPSSLDAGAGVERFSGQRAKTIVEQLATMPHVIGSARNVAIAGELADRLRELGLDVADQRATVVYDHPLRAERSTRVAWPHNLVARLRGSGERSGPGQALALMSHYDSVPSSAGAADALSGVATILETVRALVATGTPLERDLLVVLTDGEEIGLMGAQAFLRDHPAAADVGLLLNFEARGAAGVANMFQTGAGNAELLRRFGAAAPFPVANSLGVEVYRRMPNDTDATIALEADLAVLNFAFIDDFYRYHAGSDVPANLSNDAMQHAGNNALAVVRHFGSTPSPEKDSDATAFNLGRTVLVVYGPWVAWSVVVASLVVVALALGAGWKRRFSGRDLAVAMSWIVGSVVVTAWLAQSLHDAASAATPPFHLFYRYHALLAAWVCIGLIGFLVPMIPDSAGRRWALTLLAAVGVLAAILGGSLDGLAAVSLVLLIAGLTRSAGPERHAVVAIWLVLAAIAAAGTAVAALHAAYAFALPLLLAAVAAWDSWRSDEDRTWPAWACFGLGMVLWIPLVYAVYLGLAIREPAVIAVLVILIVGMAGVGSGHARRALGPLSLLAGAILLAATLLPVFDEDHPQPVELFVGHDVETSQTWWLTRDAVPSSWSREILGDAAERVSFDFFSDSTRLVWRAPAAIRELERPASLVWQASTDGNAVRNIIAIRAVTPGTRLTFELPAGAYERVSVDGRDVPVPDFGETWRWDLWGMPADRVIRIEFFSEQPTSGPLIVNELRYEWPEALRQSLPERSPTLMSSPWSYDGAFWYRHTLAVN